jgi:hypothetical protein
MQDKTQNNFTMLNSNRKRRMKKEKNMTKSFGIVRQSGLALLALGIAIALPRFSRAQITSTAVPFLLIAPDARASGMGDFGTGDPEGPGAIYWNPAGLAFQEGHDVELTYSQWLPQFNQNDLFYNFDNFKWNDEEKFGGTIGASIAFLNLGQFIYTTESSPTPLATFNSFEYSVTVAYATKLSDDWGFGGSLHYIESVLSTLHVTSQPEGGVGESVAFDVSALWKPDSSYVEGIADALQVGFMLSDVGPKIRYVNALEADPLPTELRVGASYKIYKDEYNEITIGSDLAKLMVKTDSGSSYADPLPRSLITSWDDSTLKSLMWSTGVEYWYDQLLALRMGYYSEGSHAGGRSFLTFGAGLRYDVYTFDFSYIDTFAQDDPLANTLRFTLGIKW